MKLEICSTIGKKSLKRVLPLNYDCFTLHRKFVKEGKIAEVQIREEIQVKIREQIQEAVQVEKEVQVKEQVQSEVKVQEQIEGEVEGE